MPDSAASPDLTHSSISSTLNTRSDTLKPRSRASVSSESRVTPCRKVVSRLRVRISPFADQQEIGGAGLLHLAARTEQHLIDLILRARPQRGAHRRRIIAAGLHHAHLRGRARVLVIHQDAQRLHAAGEIIPDRACEHEQQRLVRRRRRGADIRRGAEQDRPQIQRARRLRHRRRGSAR